MSTARELAQRWLVPFVDPRRILSLLRLPQFFWDMQVYKRRAPQETVKLADAFPCLMDRMPTTPFDPHYFYQGNWLARRLADAKPKQHVDIGSSILSIGVLSAYVPTVFVDYRPLIVQQKGLSCIAGNITKLPFADGALKSLSCLHVIEHIGLGRYGDPLNTNGAQVAANELQRVVAPGGRFYLSTPIGRERVCFNAHRVFAPTTILDWFSNFKLVHFSYVSDNGSLHDNVAISDVPLLEYGCGFFEFER